MVFAINDEMVIKIPRGGSGAARDQEIEMRIYQRLGQHPRIARYIRSEPRGLVLERLKKPLRKCLGELHTEGKLPSKGLIQKWSRQAIEGLQYLHQRDVLQGDIGCHNLLLDGDDHIKYCDFAGSSIDGEEAWVCCETRSQRPPDLGEIPEDGTTVSSEILALGTTLYEISTTRPPYANDSEATIIESFQANNYPDVGSLEFGNIISKCWRGIYATVDEVLTDLNRSEPDFQGSIPQRSLMMLSQVWLLGSFCSDVEETYQRYRVLLIYCAASNNPVSSVMNIFTYPPAFLCRLHISPMVVGEYSDKL